MPISEFLRAQASSRAASRDGLAQRFHRAAAAFRAISLRCFFVNFAARAGPLAAQVAVVHASFLNTAFGTVPLSLAQWLVCAAMGSVVLWENEMRKLMVRMTNRQCP